MGRSSSNLVTDAAASDQLTSKMLPPAAMWSAAVLLAVANFMAVLDLSIANVSVPNIAGGLGASPGEGTWVITSYAVAEAIIVPLTGWLTSRFGSVRVLVVAMAGFGLCSALCALSTSLNFLVVARILQGLTGGPLIPLSQALLLRIFPSHQQALAMALWSMTTVLAPVVGPLLGGVLCDAVGWPSIFWINVPISIVATLALWKCLQSHETPSRRVEVDLIGLVLLVVWVGALQLTLDLGKDHDWFASDLIVSLTVVSFVGLVTFVIWELTDDNPIVNLKILRYRGFATSLIALALAMGAYFATIVLTPLWLQTDMGYTARQAGTTMAGSGIAAFVASAVASKMLARANHKYMVVGALLYLGIISFIRSGATSQMTYGQIAMQVSFMGLGMSFFIIPLMTSALRSVKTEDLAAASGLINFVRTVAGAFGTSIVTSAWINGGSRYHEEIVSALQNTRHLIDFFVQRGMSTEQSIFLIERVVAGQAAMLSTNQVFTGCSVTFVLTALVVLLMPLASDKTRPAR
ncbi:DHA2 family efflux MFS transporter permease subunit [Ketobacter nezhaii]|uniref:DHA2 family efflux MFS transporter permease subunit n=1 Tax=Ketobacter sp. MCCC 1A13808 TaxID=2602738 RepID=UPI0018DE4029|nr:DHA2 family efflux MFS transporter permease subunit [Ketobacter sp. MCCC 1A13808]